MYNNSRTISQKKSGQSHHSSQIISVASETSCQFQDTSITALCHSWIWLRGTQIQNLHLLPESLRKQKKQAQQQLARHFIHFWTKWGFAGPSFPPHMHLHKNKQKQLSHMPQMTISTANTVQRQCQLDFKRTKESRLHSNPNCPPYRAQNYWKPLSTFQTAHSSKMCDYIITSFTTQQQ